MSEAPQPTANPRHKWYIVHAYSNFEQKVADNIREQAHAQGLDDSFSEILVPKEEVVEIRRGRKVNAERKFFPGYVLVKMDLSDVAYHLVKNTPKVTGFLGSGAKPQPISEREAARYFGGSRRPRPPRRPRSASTTTSATRSRCSKARSPASTGWSRSSISTSRRSRSRSRSSAARPRLSSTSSRSSWSSKRA